MINYFKYALLFTISLMTLTIVSCGEDDELPEPVDECLASFENQIATGSFMGDAFTFVDGSAKESSFDSTAYLYKIYGETPTGDMCDNFNFDLPEKSIIFELPKQIGIYELGTSYTLTFNNAMQNNTTAEIALCGSIEIQTVTQTNITGRLDVKVNDGSTANFLNGNFTVELCN